MRFDSPEHLQAWRETAAYPAIHDALANVVIGMMTGVRVLDLGCSYGLLGQRIARASGVHVVGVEADATVVHAAEAAGIEVRFYRLKIMPATLPRLGEIVLQEGVTTVVARRVLPELFGDNLDQGRVFAQIMVESGVEEMFVEGRVVTAKAVNALHSIDQEVALLAESFCEVRRLGAISYLRSHRSHLGQGAAAPGRV